jgi:capsular polysaccharide biosynthesis protein
MNPPSTRLALRRRAPAVPGDDGGSAATSAPAGPGLSLWEAILLPSIVNLTVALVFALLAAGGAAAFTLTTSPVYESRSVVLLSHPDVVNLPSVNPILRLNALRRTYAAVARTQQVVIPVANDVGMEPLLVARSVGVVINADSLVMYPTARADSRVAARDLADSLARELSNYVQREQDSQGLPADDRVTLRQIDPARLGTKISPTGDDAIAAAALAGGIAIAVAYGLLQVTTAERRVRRSRQLR